MKSQKERVLKCLQTRKEHGVSNFEFFQLNPPILRAAARIAELREEGFSINTIQIRKGHYKYILSEE